LHFSDINLDTFTNAIAYFLQFETDLSGNQVESIWAMTADKAVRIKGQRIVDVGHRKMADPAAVATVDPIMTLALGFVAGCGALLLQGVLHEFNRWRERGHQGDVLRTALASELHVAMDLLGQTQSVLTRADGE
jgi:hypothetical protein